MEIFSFVWQQYLYTPLFNFLIWLYQSHANFSLGAAVIILTVILRLALVPFTYLVERGKVITENLEREAEQISRDYANDPVRRKLAIRQLLRRKKIRPWAKAVVVGVQGLVLVLLYQVFIDGIQARKFYVLYPSVPIPDFINTQFFWMDIGERDLLISAIVAGYLFAEILLTTWSDRKEMSLQEQMFMVFFPAFSFLILALLPAAKSIFILTSLVFSTIVSMFTALAKAAARQRRLAAAKSKNS